MTAFRSLLTWIGGVALLLATLTDSVAVVGRYVGLPLRGSIELMQAIVLVAAASGLSLATLAANHARVKLVVDRLKGGLRNIADRISDLATALFFVALLAGSGWIALDLWGAHERSELLGIPWWLIRLYANLCLLCCVGIALRRAVLGGGK